jgi:4-amino-4-deoxy-L-arabinose transferase-like glycosyltransferase
MEINGLPAHVLVVHAAVVFVPLAATVALLYAVMPRWRWATRLLSVGLSTIALGAVVAAYYSGLNFADKFQEKNGELPAGVKLHEERADVLFWLTIVFFVVVLAAAWGLGGPSGLKSERGARGRHDPLIEWSLMGMLVVLAVAEILMTIATGDAGASAVWEGTWNFLNE